MTATPTPVQVAPADLVADHATLLKAMETSPGDLAGPPCTRFGIPVYAFEPGSIRYTLWSRTGPDRGDVFIVEALIRRSGGLPAVTNHADLHEFNIRLGEFVGLLGDVDPVSVENLLGPNWPQVAAVIRAAAFCGDLTRLRFDEARLAARHDPDQKIADMRHTAEVAEAENLTDAVQAAEHLTGPRNLPGWGPGLPHAAVTARWAARATVLRDMISPDVYQRMTEPWFRTR